MMHMHRACDAPMEICMTFNVSAATLVRHEYARAVDVVEGLDLLQEARDRGLVQFGDMNRQVKIGVHLQRFQRWHFDLAILMGAIRRRRPSVR
jgi:hypothetical protein